MAIDNNTPKGQGYIACINGQPMDSNPYYYGINSDIICRWYEWNEGWNKAYDEGRFGFESDNIQAGAEIHSDKGYSESTQEKYQEAKQRRENRREIKSDLGYSRVGMWGRK